MGFFNKYPYTNEHELNLDWIIAKINALKDRVKAVEDAIKDIVVATPNDGKLTIKRNDTIVGDFTANQATDEDINIAVPENTSDLNNDSDFITSSDLPDMNNYYDKTETDNLLSDKADISSLATVATTGDYDDLINTPTIPAAQVNSDWNANSGVAQILNKPTIPAAQVNSDWNANSGVAEILNKPTLAAVATSGSYADLSNRLLVTDWQSNSTESATANTWSHINGGSVPASAIPSGYTIDNLISLDARSTNTSGWSRIVANIRAANTDNIAISVYSNIALAGNQIHYRAIWYK